MLKPIEYEEYHAIYTDHLMRDVDILPDFRVVEIEYYDRDIKWFKVTEFNIVELANSPKPIRSVLIS